MLPMAALNSVVLSPGSSLDSEPARSSSSSSPLRFQKTLGVDAVRFGGDRREVGFAGGKRSIAVKPIGVLEESKTAPLVSNGQQYSFPNGKFMRQMSTVGKSSNILWHDCSVTKAERQVLLKQKGCVIWITGLSGSGKSTVACALSRILHSMGSMTYVLDGDNIRHGLNSNLSFKTEDRAENIRRVGEVAKLFADAGIFCIASLISPYRRDRDSCRAMLAEGDFIEVFMDIPLEVCESRDPKGLYKLARAGKIEGFTGVDDPYEIPLNCEIVLQQEPESSTSPREMAETVASYLVDHGYLMA